MIYAQIENGAVKTILPERPSGAFGNISNIETLDDAGLKELGFLPVTYSNDKTTDAYHTVDVTYEIGEDSVVGTYIFTPVSDDLWKNLLNKAVQRKLDTTAGEKNYDDIVAACSYANSTNETYKAEADACLAYRDAVWEYAINAIENKPTEEDLISGLPTINWPQ